MIPVVLAMFVELHLADGTPIRVSPGSIISMRPRGQGGHFVEGAQCLLNLADGKYIVVREKCEEVFKAIEDKER